MGGRSRHWVFTLANYTEEHRTVISTTTANASVYVCYQPEIAPTTGTPHLQGFISFANPRQLNGVKRLFAPAAPHLEPARGTVAQAVEYCQKRKRVTPTPVLDSSSLGQSQPDLAKEVGQILMLLARASVRVSRLSPLQNSSPETSFGTVGDLRSTRSSFSPDEISRQQSAGIMAPQEQGRAMLRERKLA